VLDEGVELTNNDLPAARLVVLNGSNFVPGSNTNNPDANGNGAHGTCCAGIIASEQGNTQGTAGIAPLCRIMPVRIPFGNFATSIYADAINFAWNNGADILSNSWGGGSNDFPVITAAINNAITQGRNGIGSVVVISAGNTADHNTGINGFVTYPGNVAVADVITVGASDRYDRQANYSPTGNAVDVVAPSHRAYSSQIVGESWEVWSTDITGNDGYNSRKNTDGGTLPPIGEILPSTGTNNLDYTGRMGGTSAACPEVAGVAALLLSVNSNLTPAQVFNIITNSADKVGGYNYTGGRCNQMGFGRLNAFNALSTQLWMKDTPNDPGTEPNPTSDPMYISEDIWARKTNDGITIHENPEYRNPSSGYPNSIYVRVRNAGNVPGSATLILYWAKASSGLGWPAPWDGSVTTPALMGAQIGTITTGMIPSYGESILRFDWYPPSPNDYVTFGSDQFHFCLLARLETSSTAPFGMTIPETGNLYSNVKNNNNIVWKNIIVKDDILEKRASAGLVIANYSKRDELTRIEIKLDADLPWIRYGDLTITLDPRLFRKWQEKGGKGEGFILEGEKLKLTSANVWFGDFTLKPKDIYGMLMQYTMVKKPDVKKLEDYILIIDVKQQVFKVQGKLKEVKGGVRYQLNLSRKTK